ncbi:MAG: hypothetical protein SGJ09_03215, partial [Phycisphaerae bacterium]|nr:hypothetical protein [Phycisphaerae bacterium]
MSSRSPISRPFRLTLAIGLALGATTLLGTSAASGQNFADRLNEVAKQRQSDAARDITKSSLLGALLYTDLTFDFKATKAKDAFEFIANALGVPLVVRYNTDRAAAGIDPDAEVTLKLEGKPALTALEMVLEQVGTDEPCTWQIRESFIEVGTKARLSVPAARELKMYPIRDLIFVAPHFNNAPTFNLSESI